MSDRSITHEEIEELLVQRIVALDAADYAHRPGQSWHAAALVDSDLETDSALLAHLAFDVVSDASEPLPEERVRAGLDIGFRTAVLVPFVYELRARDAHRADRRLAWQAARQIGVALLQPHPKMRVVSLSYAPVGVNPQAHLMLFELRATVVHTLQH